MIVTICASLTNVMENTKKIRVLIIDDSRFMRLEITDILNSDPEIEVVGTAKDGVEGIKKIHILKPDVVTLDYEMPGLDGLNTLKKIMNTCPLPIVMISAYTPAGGRITLEALGKGAIDYVLKPSGPVSLDIERHRKDEIINRVKVASRVKLEKLKKFFRKRGEKLELPSSPLIESRIIAIGSSTGGIGPIELIFETLPESFPAPLIIAQHMPKMFTGLFAERLNQLTQLSVKEAEVGEIIKGNYAYVAPGDKHMEVLGKKSQVLIRLLNASSKEELMPSIDILMKSVAKTYGNNAIGVLLSGMGSDGVEGMEAIHEGGGTTIAQDEKTSLIFGMPKQAIEQGVVDHVLPADMIAQKLLSLLKV